MKKINFTLSELIYSSTATRNHIANYPDINSLDNLLNLIIYCLQPIRDILCEPMIITSGYRCKEVNKLVNGKSNSQHLFGQAADFKVKKYTPDKIIKLILNSNIEFDQLINENNKWVHISFVKGKNRKQYFKI